jgi:hypothetical protein
MIRSFLERLSFQADTLVSIRRQVGRLGISRMALRQLYTKSFWETLPLSREWWRNQRFGVKKNDTDSS